MTTTAGASQNSCFVCGETLSDSMRHCPTCRTDVGAPNVRFCRRDKNKQALTSRFDDAKRRANDNGCLKEFEALEEVVKLKSSVIISMPAGIARKLLEDPRSLYANYEQLVGSSARIPADFYNDSQRFGVGGVLFGSYAGSIIYGALSLTGNGLPTYGHVFCKLRSVAIDKRTSFLVTNSYKFVKDHNIVPGDNVPDGYSSCWEDRHYLVTSKLSDSLSVGQTESDWQAILIQSDAQKRENDEFVEAHIFEGFNNNAIETMVAASGQKLSKGEKLDLDIAIDKFESIKGNLK